MEADQNLCWQYMSEGTFTDVVAHVLFLVGFLLHSETKSKTKTLVTTTTFVLNNIAIKMNWLLYRIPNSKRICKNGLVLFLFPHRTYVLDIF